MIQKVDWFNHTEAVIVGPKMEEDLTTIDSLFAKVPGDNLIDKIKKYILYTKSLEKKLADIKEITK